jgi:hypothetical protein
MKGAEVDGTSFTFYLAVFSLGKKRNGCLQNRNVKNVSLATNEDNLYCTHSGWNACLMKKRSSLTQKQFAEEVVDSN